MEKRNPIQKSIVRHELKKIDAKFPKVAGPAKHKALSHMSENAKLWKRFPHGPTPEAREKVENEHRGEHRERLKEHIKRFEK